MPRARRSVLSMPSMPSMLTTYAYRAARSDGAIETGTLDAPSREAASASLTRGGLFPIELTLEAAPEVRCARVGVAPLALGFRLLADLLEAGLPVARALAAFESLAPAEWRAGLPSVRIAVREGKTLASALAASPLEIPSLALGIVQAGEAGSGLAPAVRRAADLLETQAATRAAIVSALTYPLILAFAGSASLMLLVGVVLPRFAAILADLGQTLPSSTRLVLGAADAIRAWAVPGALGAAVLLVVWRVWSASEEGRRQWHAVLLRVPLAGPVRRAAAVSRVTASLAALLESGVPLGAAIAYAGRSAGDAALSVRLAEARECVMTGARLSRALEETAATTPTAVKLVRAGEETGRLAAMLAHAARMEREGAERAVKAAVKFVEPLLILAFGLVIAVVSASLLQAIYSVRPG